MSEVQRVVRATNVRVLPRTQEVRVAGPGVQVWRDRNRNQLLARFASARDRGYVQEVTPIKFTKQRDYVMLVRVLKAPPSRVPWYVGAAVASMGASVTIGLAAWHARYALLTLAGVALALPLLYWFSTHFRIIPAHCPCCKNG